MQGRFEGLNEAQSEMFGPFLPSARTGRGRPYASFIRVLNTLIRILINGAKWASIPKGPQWSPKSTAHDWLGRWKEDGTWAEMLARILGIACIAGLIDRSRASADGSFVPGKGGGEGVDHGYKGKGVTLHSLADGNGMPLSASLTGASGSEREQIGILPDSVDIRTGMIGRPKKRPESLQTDKGYDSRELRNKIRRRGISPMIPRRKWKDRKPPKGRPPSKPVDRWKAERTFSWLRIKFRRIAVRWERRNRYWQGFVYLALCMLWIERILSYS